ncbi:MAG: septal ring lytic transglycosylase RlpA family protein [Sphaerochaeta sp.]|jgi:rare lipoprotein A|nr:septal ring lytic transglycosylase RlpA family protein [Sphaerochaeta sp.]
MKRLLCIVTLICLALFPVLAAEDDELSGIASWYTSDNSESLTANGEAFDPQALTAAHKTLKFGTIVKVTNTKNGKSVEVKINDRGPFVEGRIIDLTPKAAQAIGMLEAGISPVTLTIVYEPEVPESKYNRAGDTGWYLLQVGAFSSPSTALVRYEQMRQAGLRPYAELPGRWSGSPVCPLGSPVPAGNSDENPLQAGIRPNKDPEEKRSQSVQMSTDRIVQTSRRGYRVPDDEP